MHSQRLPSIAAIPGYEDEYADGLLAASEKINLDLGIGSCACANGGRLKRNEKIKQVQEKSLFTAAQLHEFKNQILVYNSIASGLPVPFHLFLPIWMNVFSSLGPAVYKKYPSFIGFSPRNSDHSSMVDPEPGRCRRTDGRKWRCSKNVVPNQKYCERHMHRGRLGSRKHVEPIESVLGHDNRTSDDNRMPIISLVAADVDNRIAFNVRSDLDTSRPFSNYSNSVSEIFCRSDKNRDAVLAIQTVIKARSLGDEVNKNVNIDYATTRTCTNSMKSGATDGGNHTGGKDSCFENANPRKICSRKQSGAENKYLDFISPRFGLSPKSVLHSGAGKVTLDLGNKNAMETEPQRCRRTDGKKWQCRQNAIPNQKYCEVHVHRGAKRFRLKPESVGNVPATSAYEANISCTIVRSPDNGINLNTMPSSPQHTTGHNSTSSTSDATTITDENISLCLANSLNNC